MRLKLILAVSSDGYLANGPRDDMRWTGRDDKGIFKLLTLSGLTPVMLAGRTTAEAMPPGGLPGRAIHQLSRRGGHFGYDLRDAARLWPSAWLIGGPSVAVEALRLGLVAEAYLCHSEVRLVPPSGLEGAISAAEVLSLLPQEKIEHRIRIGNVRVELYSGINRGA